MKKIKISSIFLLFVSTFALAGGKTPFEDQTALAQTPDSDLIAPDTSNLTAFTSSDIPILVASMRSTAETCKATNNAIGLKSGLSTRKDGIWTAKDIWNAEGLTGVVVPTSRKKYNIAWFPDDKKAGAVLQNSVRFTTGRLKIGSMPPLGQAHLEIPIENIKKETRTVGNQTYTKYWFKAQVTKVYENGVFVGYSSNLDPDLNYFKVLTKEIPILDFLGYYDTSGDWDIKVVINSPEQIYPPDYGETNPNHPDLDLEFYSQGKALQRPYHDCTNYPGQ